MQNIFVFEGNTLEELIIKILNDYKMHNKKIVDENRLINSWFSDDYDEYEDNRNISKYLSQRSFYQIIDHPSHNKDLRYFAHKLAYYGQENKTVLHSHAYDFEVRFFTKNIKWMSPYSQMIKNGDIPFVEEMEIHARTSIETSSNTRKGLFEQVDYNVFKDIELNANEWLAFGICLGDEVGVIYIPKHMISQGIALAHLFEITVNIPVKPAFIYVYGYPAKEKIQRYCYDQETDIWLGLVAGGEEIEYFGYVKKMILTLWNAKNIFRGRLPLHGAMVNLKTNGKEYGIAFIGDSGAGKSETLEALKFLMKDDPTFHLEVVFDDMGTMTELNGEIVAQGTEIGAFVRLDDLDHDYLYQYLDSCVLMNANQVNARAVIGANSFDYVSQWHKIDALFYINNYEIECGHKIFKTMEAAKETFIKGKRLAKGTTDEIGFSETFFANPFGCVQNKEQCNNIIDVLFQKMSDSNKPIGLLYTKLGYPEYTSKGPEDAAKELVKILKKL